MADVASIERAWTQAYHAPEASPLDPAAFMLIEPDQLRDIRLLLHPSLRVVRSQLPALTIWRMNVGDGVPTPVDLASGGENVLVVRPMADVEVRSLPEGGPEFIQALAEGLPVVAAIKIARVADHHFDLSANLSGLMRAGALIGHSLGNPVETPMLAR